MIILHLGLLLALLQPARPWPLPRADDTHRDALQVWLLSHAVVRDSARATGLRKVAPRGHATPHPRPPLTATAPTSPATSMHDTTATYRATAVAPPATAPLQLGLPVGDMAAHTASGYIPGGGRLSSSASGQGSAIDSHLPGRDGGLPGVVMADPQRQGVAGAIRVVRQLLGLRDKQCIDVAVWRGMTTQELLDHHLDEKTVEAVAARHGCGLKPEAPFHNWRDFGAPVH